MVRPCAHLAGVTRAKLCRVKVPIPETHAAQQVAYAWQVATRDLRFTHPELHAQLTEKVRQLLDVEVLDDPALEIHRLQAAIAAMKAELDELRQALADAVPGIDTKVPPGEAARLRMRYLIEAGSRGSGLSPPAHLRHGERLVVIVAAHVALRHGCAPSHGTPASVERARRWCGELSRRVWRPG